jgi:predicted metal-binding membrane protein
MQRAMMSEGTGHDFSHLPPAVAGLGHVLARPKVLAAFCVIVLAGLGWLYLALILAGMGGSSIGFGPGVLKVLCGPLTDGSWSAAYIATIGSMWAAMTLAMMLPSATPMILTYAGIADAAARQSNQIITPIALVGGYIAVWLAFSVAATLMQIIFVKAALLDASMASTDKLFTGVIFVAAGFYQFSALKNACLTRCQQPFPFFFANWATTPDGVFRLGLKQGLYCLGCCWAMMLVMFAVGVMNVVWMAALGIIMTIEKMLTGRRFTHVVGAALIAVGTGVVLAALVGHWPVQTG